jgi:hypothetical protein
MYSIAVCLISSGIEVPFMAVNRRQLNIEKKSNSIQNKLISDFY